MCFLLWDLIAFLLLMIVFKSECANLLDNKNVFELQDINQCNSNEFYDLDYFKCLPCGEVYSNLQQTSDKFSCQCVPNSVELALYDTLAKGSICVDVCLNENQKNKNNSNNFLPNKDIKQILNNNNSKKCLPITNSTNSSKTNCKYKYVNTSVITQQPAFVQPGNFKHLRITRLNPNRDENCTVCNLQYNIQYEDLCIFIPLMKPYLNYNDFWQQTSTYNNLKFVAFLCLSLHNTTACNHLANLCVISFYSFDKDSPCSPFLLAQATDSLLRYAHLDVHLKQLHPFLFYKKGKETKKLITEPLNRTQLYNDRALSKNSLHFFNTVYTADGSLHRWGTFRSGHINLCRLHNRGVSHVSQAGDYDSEEYIFDGNNFVEQSCQLSLENIIDLTQLYGNNYFFSIYLNFKNENNPDQVYLQSVPVLIENLSPENQHSDMEEWQLVRRFQLFESHTRFKTGAYKKIPIYEDEHKLLLYRQIRFVDKFEIHCTILEGNRITIPIIKLHYRSVEFRANSSLDRDIYRFSFRIRFISAPQKSSNDIDPFSDGILFAVLLLLAFSITSLRTYNLVRRRRHQQHASSLTDNELCDFACFTEFFLSLISNVANAILMFFLIYISHESFRHMTQYTATTTLPFDINMTVVIFVALILKLIYLSVYFWRMGHIDIFFIDWERRKNCDTNHFNLKNYEETVSVCSSARTAVASENNVSVWRTFYIANEWIVLSGKQKTSTFIQCIFSFVFFTILERSYISSYYSHCFSLPLFVLTGSYVGIFCLQLSLQQFLIIRIFGHPLQKFVDICSFANISIFALLDTSHGFYIHGRSPHGFADTDISSLLLQLQRESQNMCGKRGLLNDSCQQTYVIFPPINLRTYCENILIPLQKSCNMSETNLKNDSSMSMTYSGINRFFCAFIDHAIRDMDYIIKDKTLGEKLLRMEFNNLLTRTKGTFYTDTNFAFSQLFLYGNTTEILLMELLVLLFIFIVTTNAPVSIAVVCSLNKLFQQVYPSWIRQNIATKTLIDKRFLK